MASATAGEAWPRLYVSGWSANDFLRKEKNMSQSRVAKMEAGDPSVSVDLMMKSLFSLGVSTKQVAKTIAAL